MEKGWSAGGGGGGGAAAAAAATRSGHQETDVNGGKVYVLRMLVLVSSSLIKGPSIYGRLQPGFCTRISNYVVNDFNQPDSVDAVQPLANLPLHLPLSFSLSFSLYLSVVIPPPCSLKLYRFYRQPIDVHPKKRLIPLFSNFCQFPSASKYTRLDRRLTFFRSK